MQVTSTPTEAAISPGDAALGAAGTGRRSLARQLRPRMVTLTAAVLSLVSSAACLLALEAFLRSRRRLSAVLMQWDATWWRQVALHGYWSPANPLYGQHVVYFPVLPLLERFGRDTTGSLELFIIVLNIAAQAVAAMLLLHIARRCGAGDGEALAWVALFVISPPVVFDVMGYDISLLTLFLFAAVFFVQRRHGWWAAASIGLASATNPLGIAFAAGFALWWVLELLRTGEFGWRSLATLTGRVVLGFSGILAYMLYLFVRFDAPFSFYKAAGYWAPAQRLSSVVEGIVTFGPVRGSIWRWVASPYGAHTSQLIDAGSVILVVALLVTLIATQGGVRTVAFWALAAAFVLSQVEAARFGYEESTTRFLLPVAFVAAAIPAVSRRLTRPVVFIALAALLAAGTIFFLHNLATGQWVD